MSIAPPQTGDGFLLEFGFRLFKSQQRTLITDPVPTGLPATGEYKHAIGKISTPGERENKIGTGRWVEAVVAAVPVCQRECSGDLPRAWTRQARSVEPRDFAHPRLARRAAFGSEF